MAVAARSFELDKAERDKLLITKDHSLMFSTVQVARDHTRPGSLLDPGGGKMRDPGNEVDDKIHQK